MQFLQTPTDSSNMSEVTAIMSAITLSNNAHVHKTLHQPKCSLIEAVLTRAHNCFRDKKENNANHCVVLNELNGKNLLLGNILVSGVCFISGRVVCFFVGRYLLWYDLTWSYDY